jgi:hypothetical protein
MVHQHGFNSVHESEEHGQIGDKLMLGKRPLIFVSPGWVKMGRAVITPGW